MFREMPSPAPFVLRDTPYAGHCFGDDLREFISLRLDKVNPYAESKEYCRQQERAERLYDRLAAALPEEGRAMLVEYSEALGAAHYLEVAVLAERAFMDGVRLILKAVVSLER